MPANFISIMSVPVVCWYGSFAVEGIEVIFSINDMVAPSLQARREQVLRRAALVYF
jgi:hypothetical protein